MDFEQYITKFGKRDAFGAFVKERRQQLGLSVRQLAKKLEMTPAYLSDIENGNRSAPKQFLSKFILELEISTEQESNFLDFAYAMHNTCSPDLIEYLIAHPHLRKAIRILNDKNISDKAILKMVEEQEENIKL